MSCIHGETVSVARRAGGGITHAARRYDKAAAGPFSAVGGQHLQSGTYAFYLDFRLDLDAGAMACAHERIHHVGRMVAGRICTVAPLHHALHAERREEIQGLRGGEIIERRLEEIGIGADMGAELVPVLHVGEIAPSLSGNHDLPAGTRHFLEHGDTGG